MTVPLIVLSFGAAFAGFLEFNHVFADFLGRTPSLAFQDFLRVQPEEMSHPEIVAVSIVLAFSGVGLAAYLYLGDAGVVNWLTRWLRPLYVLSYGKLFFDQIYQLVFVWPAWLLALVCYWIDRWIVDGLVNFVGGVAPFIGARLRPLQRGLVPFYALAMILGALVLIGTMLFTAG